MWSNRASETRLERAERVFKPTCNCYKEIITHLSSRSCFSRLYLLLAEREHRGGIGQLNEPLSFKASNCTDEGFVQDCITLIDRVMNSYGEMLIFSFIKGS